jgi:hypothetical protein
MINNKNELFLKIENVSRKTCPEKCVQKKEDREEENREREMCLFLYPERYDLDQ